ncbi:hypothetical protein CR513_36348, partial [Mucuna pruriens]
NGKKGREDHAIANALVAFAGAIRNNQNNIEDISCYRVHSQIESDVWTYVLVEEENIKWLFLEKYFPKDGNSIVVEYVAKFEDLSRYYPHYLGEVGKHLKCVKFINGLCPKIKQFFNYLEIY